MIQKLHKVLCIIRNKYMS